MASAIEPFDGSLLPTNIIIPVSFTYDPVDGGKGQIPINWHSTSYSVKFATPQTSTDDNGLTRNEICYNGDTPSTPPTITLRNAATNDLLFQFAYDFRCVSFLQQVMWYPDGIQTMWPFGGGGAPLVNGVKLRTWVIDPTRNNNAVANFRVLFSSVHNAVDFYDIYGGVIDPLPLGLGQSTTLKYPCLTDEAGAATVIAMSKTAGIFNLRAGVGSRGQSVQGRIVVLNEVAPPEDFLLGSLEFLTESNDTIELDESQGPTFPVQAPASMMVEGPVEPTDPVVIVTYPATRGQHNALITGRVVSAQALVQGIGITKQRALTGGALTCYYYLASNGVSYWQSATRAMLADGAWSEGPDLTVHRLTGFFPSTPNVSVINATTIVGGLKVVADAFLLTKMGLLAGDGYTFNVYLDGWSASQEIEKRDFFSRAGVQQADATAITEILPQEWFAGYGHKGSLTSTAWFEFVGYPRETGGDAVYSDLLKLAIDTSD